MSKKEMTFKRFHRLPMTKKLNRLIKAFNSRMDDLFKSYAQAVDHAEDEEMSDQMDSILSEAVIAEHEEFKEILTSIGQHISMKLMRHFACDDPDYLNELTEQYPDCKWTPKKMSARKYKEYAKAFDLTTEAFPQVTYLS